MWNCRDSLIGHCRSFKVINFVTNEKPVCHFLLVNNSNCGPANKGSVWSHWQCMLSIRISVYLAITDSVCFLWTDPFGWNLIGYRSERPTRAMKYPTCLSPRALCSRTIWSRSVCLWVSAQYSQLHHLMHWLHAKDNYLDIILQLFQCFISYVTRSEIEIELFQPLKEFWNYFKIISVTLNMLVNIHELKWFQPITHFADWYDNDVSAVSIRSLFSNIFLY